MKKNIYLILFGLLFFVACNSTEDIYDELDENDTGLKYDVTYTLDDGDYEWLDEEYGVGGPGNFESEDEAREYIPALTTHNYPQFGQGSSAVVTYALYDPIRINNASSYTLTEEDYDAIDETYGTLSSESDITKAVKYKYPAPEEQDVVTLTYEWYASGVTSTQTSKVVYYESTWRIAYTPTDEDYTYMGQSYPNFESRSTGRARIAVLFDEKFPFGAEGEIRTAIFTYTYVIEDENGDDERIYEDFLVAYQFDGSNWIPFDDVVSRTLQFGNDGEAWIPDNTIKYTLATADYTAIAANPDLGNTAAQSNLASYGNFNTGGGYWTTEEIYEAIGYVLLTNFPGSEVGQKYQVTYNTYPGGDLQVHLILTEAGSYEVVSE